jgi:tyrosine-protein phosphatase YwqE
LVDVVASDAHSDTYRPTAMRFAYDYVNGRFGEAMAQQLFVTTPQKLIAQ